MGAGTPDPPPGAAGGAPARAGGVFLSYRRDETEHVAGRLADRLGTVFGEDRVFIDVDSIPPGEDFVEAIQQAVRQADVLLALIGPTWTRAADERGNRRLDDPEDFVVLELAEALQRGVHVVPVLVDGAPMPRREELPPALQPLVRRNAVRVDGESFRSDVGALLERLAAVVPVGHGGRPGGTGPLGVVLDRRAALRLGAGAAAVALTGGGAWDLRRRLAQTPPPVWDFRTGGEVYSSPAVAGDALYVGSNDARLYCLDVRTGEERWHYETGGAVTSSPAVEGGVVYVGSNDTSLHAVDAASGKGIWAFPTGGALHSSPALDGESVYVGSRDNALYAVDRATGQERWRFHGGPHDDLVTGFNSSPAVVDGVVYVGCRDHNVYAVDAAGGFQRWRRTTGSTVDSSPTVAGGSLFIGSDDHTLMALRTVDGVPIWVFTAEAGITSTPCFQDGIVYVGSDDGRLYAVDAGTGRLRWRAQTEGAIRSSPAVASGLVHVGSRDFHLYALDVVDGSVRWSFRTRAPIDDSSPAVADGRVHVGSLDRHVYSVDASRGAELAVSAASRSR